MHHWHWHFNSLMNNISSPGNSINYQFDVDPMLDEHTTTFWQSDLISTTIFHTNTSWLKLMLRGLVFAALRWWWQRHCHWPRSPRGPGGQTPISRNNRTHSDQFGTQACGKDLINWTMCWGKIWKVLEEDTSIIQFIFYWFYSNPLSWEIICHNPGLQGRNK